MTSRPRGPGGILLRTLSYLAAVGVVLGIWRLLGHGASVTDPEWLKNAVKSLSAFGDKVAQLIDGLVGERAS
ncbi:hypothetical protein [Streptomyces sp. NPDC051572]|uniref:hypothetical protein n=1 Tax=Streptomyces sp. NPDC051572 TaxID=3155802 RepID=UPI00344D54B9